MNQVIAMGGSMGAAWLVGSSSEFGKGLIQLHELSQA